MSKKTLKNTNTFLRQAFDQKGDVYHNRQLYEHDGGFYEVKGSSKNMQLSNTKGMHYWKNFLATGEDPNVTLLDIKSKDEWNKPMPVATEEENLFNKIFGKFK
jgi:phage head maturation protease